ncbi:MAG: 6-carboxytetrahydropterin synthase QueD [Deltaproteobacteria bacterium]|nr:6-carboxytetrahydropterin synthase QueD [Deltaproteobacteria bacterium]
MFELRKTFRFEAAHSLPNVPAGHKCARLHGHSFRAEVVVRGALDPKLQWVIDYADLKAVCQPWFDQLDHNHLNEIEGLDNPTSEVVCQWLWTRIAPRLPGLHAITVRETCTSACTYYGPTAFREVA